MTEIKEKEGGGGGTVGARPRRTSTKLPHRDGGIYISFTVTGAGWGTTGPQREGERGAQSGAEGGGGGNKSRRS